MLCPLFTGVYLAVALVNVKLGGMRELHWHPNDSEGQYFVSGKARTTVLWRRPSTGHSNAVF